MIHMSVKAMNNNQPQLAMTLIVCPCCKKRNISNVHKVNFRWVKVENSAEYFFIYKTSTHFKRAWTLLFIHNMNQWISFLNEQNVVWLMFDKKTSGNMAAKFSQREISHSNLPAQSRPIHNNRIFSAIHCHHRDIIIRNAFVCPASFKIWMP